MMQSFVGTPEQVQSAPMHGPSRTLSNEIEGITAVTFTPKLSSEVQDMNETLAEKKCTPCRGGIAPLTHEEAERFRSQTPN